MKFHLQLPWLETVDQEAVWKSRKRNNRVPERKDVELPNLTSASTVTSASSTSVRCAARNGHDRDRPRCRGASPTGRLPRRRGSDRPRRADERAPQRREPNRHLTSPSTLTLRRLAFSRPAGSRRQVRRRLTHETRNECLRPQSRPARFWPLRRKQRVLHRLSRTAAPAHGSCTWGGSATSGIITVPAHVDVKCPVGSARSAPIINSEQPEAELRAHSRTRGIGSRQVCRGSSRRLDRAVVTLTDRKTPGQAAPRAWRRLSRHGIKLSATDHCARPVIDGSTATRIVSTLRLIRLPTRLPSFPTLTAAPPGTPSSHLLLAQPGPATAWLLILGVAGICTVSAPPPTSALTNTSADERADVCLPNEWSVPTVAVDHRTHKVPSCQVRTE